MLAQLYKSAAGMEAQRLKMDAAAHDLSNINTTAYKKSKVEFQDLMSHEIKPIGGDNGNGNAVPTGIQIGNGTKLSAIKKIFTQGELQESASDLDLAIDGQGFFEIEMADGSSVYTRDGSLTTSGGKIVTSDGYNVKSFSGTIPDNRQSIYISGNGQVTVETPDGTQSFNITLARFANPGGLKSIGNNLYEITAASGDATTGKPGENGFGVIKQGFTESSNVNAITCMVDIIAAQRAYEMNAKGIQAAGESAAKLNQLL